MLPLRRGRSVSEIFSNVRRHGLALRAGWPWIGGIIVNECVLFVFSHGAKGSCSHYTIRVQDDNGILCTCSGME
jgi:anti-sigma regulatory factor (Ser/Thr protein kinase)